MRPRILLILTSLTLLSCGASGASSQSQPTASTSSASQGQSSSESPSTQSESGDQASSPRASQESSSQQEDPSKQDSEPSSTQSQHSSGEEGSGSSDASNSSPQEDAPTANELTKGASYDNAGFSIVRADDGSVPSFDSGVYFITQGGTYSLSGDLVGMVFVNVPETEDKSGEVTLELNGASLSFSGNSPIYCLSADSLDISAKKGSENTIADLRPLQTEEEEYQGGGAIYAKVDTKLKGAGTLKVNGSYNNGVHVTKDLEIQKLTLSSTAVNTAIKGTDSLTINSGEVTAISTAGDGLKTSDYDVSAKGVQRGNLAILGGSVNVYSGCDGASAAYDFTLGSEGAENGPSVNILTNKYSSYTDEEAIEETSTSKMYLRTTANLSNTRYSVLFYDTDPSSGSWKDATYLTSRQSGGGMGSRRAYYYYEVERPASLTSFQVYAFDSSAENSLADYKAKSSGATVNSYYDTLTFSISGTSITGNGWSNYSQGGQGGPGGGMGPGGGDQGNTDKASSSAKGIKAAHAVYLYSGTLNIKAYDDAIHANDDNLFSTESTPIEGNVYLKGGDVELYASDDGVHADNGLYVEGGNIKVTNAYEAYEGNRIYVTGGVSELFATNDVVNACDGNLDPLISVSGGYLFGAVALNGDTDGIDSNGDYAQSGGTVIIAGPRNGGAWALDADYTVTVNGGTLVVFGGIERYVDTSSAITYTTKSGTFRGQAYTLTFAKGSVVTKALPNYSYSSCLTYSELGTLQSIA